MTFRGLNDTKRDRAYFRIAVLVALLVLCILLIQMYGKVFRQNGNDFVSYLMSAKALMRGDSPYETGSIFPYIYPPFLALIMIPLSFLPLWLSGLLWFLLNASAFVLVLKSLLTMLFESWEEDFVQRAWAVAAAISLLAFDILQNHFLNGQVNFIVLALIILFYKSTSQGKEIPAAVFLSLGGAIKLVPLIFLAYLLFRRKIRAVLYVIMLTSLLMLLPYLLVGHKLFSFYGDYLHRFILSKVGISGEIGTGRIEYSLHSFIKVMFPSGGIGFPLLAVSLVLVMAPIVCMELSKSVEKGRLRNLWIFCLYLIAILLISPMSEIHHLVLFIPALTLGGVAFLFHAEYVSFGRLFFYISAFVLLLLGKAFHLNSLYFLSLAAGYCSMIAMIRVRVTK